jgi:hypothetical protein
VRRKGLELIFPSPFKAAQHPNHLSEERERQEPSLIGPTGVGRVDPSVILDSDPGDKEDNTRERSSSL